MQRGVAVRADGHQVTSGIDLVLDAAARGNGGEVVDVQAARELRPIDLLEAHAAHATRVAVVAQAGRARGRVALVGIHRDRAHGTFLVLGCGRHLIRP